MPEARSELLVYPVRYNLGMDTAHVIRDARRGAGLTQTELAERSGTSQATISAYEHGAKTPTPATLARVLGAAGRRLTTVAATRAVRIPTARELEDRSRWLVQVMDLAERLPARRSKDLAFPRLPRSAGA
jgi:transcriptional regulator with XRE-family HTH domain